MLAHVLKFFLLDPSNVIIYLFVLILGTLCNKEELMKEGHAKIMPRRHVSILVLDNDSVGFSNPELS